MKAGKISSTIQKLILRLDEQVKSYYGGQITFLSDTRYFDPYLLT